MKADNSVAQAMARCNKCRSGFYPRSAARAALDLKSATLLKTCTCKVLHNSRGVVARLGRVVRLTGASRCCIGVLETARRPRGASRTRSAPTVCFGPILSVASPGTALYFRCRSPVNQQGGPGRYHRHNWPETNGRSGPCPRSAVRTALDLKGAIKTKPGTWRPSCHPTQTLSPTQPHAPPPAP
ncbi:hypothetical protein ACVW0A_006280 [Pseudomonas sp. TE3610]